MARVMSDPARVRILSLLVGREVCVCELCDVLGMRQSTLSTHLAVIRRAGIARGRKEGRWMHYALATEWQGAVRGFLGLPLGRGPAVAWMREDARRLRAVRRGDAGDCAGGVSEGQARGARAKGGLDAA